MRYSEDVIEEVRQRSDIVDVISGYVKLQRRGSNYFGLCPFHNEKSPSFSVNSAKQIFYCFGCGAGGDVFTFIQQYESFSFQEALRFLAERAGLSLPEQEESDADRMQRSLKSRILELNKTAAKFFYYQLRSPQGASGMEYLKKRQLSDETMRHFGLGFAGTEWKQLYYYLKQQGIPDDVLKESGLMAVTERQGMYDKFRNRVMFPIMDVNSRVIGFGGRVMDDGKPKYLNSPETVVFDKSRNLYGLNFARNSRAKSYLVCEGYMDVIAMHQAGFTNSVASLGTALTSQHASLLRRYTQEVILTYDSDEAGIRAAMRAIPLLKEAGISTRVLHMSPYKDPDEFMKALGHDAFQERIDQAENSFQFELTVTEKSYDMKDPAGKTRFFQAVAAKIAGFELEVERENYIEAVVARYQTSFEGMRKLVQNELLKGAPAPVIRPRSLDGREGRREKDDGMRRSQRLLLTWLTDYPKLYQTAAAYIRPGDFTDGLYCEVAAMLFGQLSRGELNPAKITSHFTEPEEQRQVAEIFSTQAPLEAGPETEKAVAETIRKIMAWGIEKQSAQLDPSDMQGLQSLIQAKKRLQSLKNLHISLE